jgi:hypothetical protein
MQGQRGLFCQYYRKGGLFSKYYRYGYRDIGVYIGRIIGTDRGDHISRILGRNSGVYTPINAFWNIGVQKVSSIG